MKHVITWVMIIGITSLWAQQDQLSNGPVTGFPSVKNHHSQSLSWEDIDRQSGKIQLTAGAGFVGSSVAYFHQGNGRFLYGLHIDILPIATGNDLVSGYYNAGLPGISETNLLIPFWLSLKIRLTHRPASKIAPYIITGLGPALSLKMTNNLGFFDALSSLNADLGGGAYLGVGIDYLWAESWAISADVRYLALDFDTPLRFSEEQGGISFAIGFMRAF